MGYEKCDICPRKCNINRYKELGFCRQSNTIKIAKTTLYQYEEPCISNKNGSGAIFFTGCNLRCVFCQNFELSFNNFGEEITVDRLSEIMLELQSKGADNINLITPDIYIPSIKEAIIKAKENNLNIPIVYNTNSYTNIEYIKELDGLIDVYMPDLKYYDDQYSIKYSKCNNYFEIASNNIKEMYKQVGNPIYDDNGKLLKGVIVRHLMLPGLSNDTKKILDHLYNTYHDNVIISLMNQYTPINVQNYPEINKKIDNNDYYDMIDYAYNLGIENCYCQEDETQKESFIPKWDLEGIKKEDK